MNIVTKKPTYDFVGRNEVLAGKRPEQVQHASPMIRPVQPRWLIGLRERGSVPNYNRLSALWDVLAKSMKKKIKRHLILIVLLLCQSPSMTVF